MRREQIWGNHKDYLGDGVYAGLDHAGQIWLQTEREEGHVERIALDAGTFQSLLRYERRLREQFAEEARITGNTHDG